MMKRSDNQVDLNRHFSHRRAWTNEEDELLMSYSKTLKDNNIALIMGRTVPSIWSRRKRLRKEGVNE